MNKNKFFAQIIFCMVFGQATLAMNRISTLDQDNVSSVLKRREVYPVVIPLPYREPYTHKPLRSMPTCSVAEVCASASNRPLSEKALTPLKDHDTEGENISEDEFFEASQGDEIILQQDHAIVAAHDSGVSEIVDAPAVGGSRGMGGLALVGDTVPAFIAEAAELKLDKRPLSVDELQQVIPLLNNYTRAFLWVGPCTCDDLKPLAPYDSVVKLNLENALNAKEFKKFWKLFSSWEDDGGNGPETLFRNLESLDLSGESLPESIRLPAWSPKALSALTEFSCLGRNLLWNERYKEPGDGLWTLGKVYEGKGSHVAACRANVLRFYQKSAEQGNAYAHWDLGQIYAQGIFGIEKDLPKALELFQKASESNPEKNWDLGQIYAKGVYGVERDRHKALEFFYKAVEYKPDVYKYWNLGEMCTDETYDIYHPELALHCFHKAAERDPKRYRNLGAIYADGTYGIKKDLHKARELFRKAIECDPDPDQWYLGELYALGAYGVEKDLPKALDLFHKAAESKPEGYKYWSLGTLYAYTYKNYGIEKDLPKALEFFRKAAECETWRYWYFAQIYAQGTYGLDKNLSKALELFHKAAEHNLKKNWDLGQIYAHGTYGIKEDLPKALELFHKAAESKPEGYKYWSLGTLYATTGTYIYKNYGIEKDLSKALEFFHKAAECETMRYWDLGRIYAEGEYGIEKDLSKALEFFHKVAECETSRSWDLGRIYAEGRYCIEKDLAKALEFFHKAAENDSWWSSLELGMIYAQGTYGIEKDLVKAGELFNKVKKYEPEGEDLRVRNFRQSRIRESLSHLQNPPLRYIPMRLLRDKRKPLPTAESTA